VEAPGGRTIEGPQHDDTSGRLAVGGALWLLVGNAGAGLVLVDRAAVSGVLEVIGRAAVKSTGNRPAATAIPFATGCMAPPAHLHSAQA